MKTRNAFWLEAFLGLKEWGQYVRLRCLRRRGLDQCKALARGSAAGIAAIFRASPRRRAFSSGCTLRRGSANRKRIGVINVLQLLKHKKMQEYTVGLLATDGQRD